MGNTTINTVLTELVTKVLQSGESQTLSADESRDFYNNFGSEVSNPIEELRSEKRRAYEEVRNIALL